MNQRRDDGYRDVRAVIYRDIARVVVILALLAAVIYVASMRSQEWQLKALGVKTGVLKQNSTATIYRNGDELSIVPRGANSVVAAKIELTATRVFYGTIKVPEIVADVFEAEQTTTTTTILFLHPEVAETDVSEFIRTDKALSRSVMMPGIGAFAPPTRPAVRPARLGWVMWKYAKLPFWIGVALLALAFWLLRPRFPRMLRRARRGHCWKCNYDLDNTLPTCPECGSKAWRSSFALFRRVPLRDSPTL